MPKVNVWELLTTVAGKDVMNSDRCREIKEAAAQQAGFGTELEFAVVNGVWTVAIFDHYDPDNSVELTVSPTGDVAVTRTRTQGDVTDRRTVSF